MNRVSYLNILLTLGISGWLVLSSGCAASGAQSGGDRDVLTVEEIREASASDVYRLIQTLRPTWLQVRGAVTASTVQGDEGVSLANPDVVVYVDGNRLGSVADLASISTVGVTSIRRLNAREATTRFGTGHTRGAILVSRQP